MPLVSRTFDQLIDFTRTSSATFVGSNGLIQSTPASRNLLTFTEEFDNAAWVKTNATVTANTTVSPDGTANADRIVENTAAGAHAVGNSAGTVSATETLSIYAKPAGRTWIALQLGAGVVAYYDIQNGVLGSVTGGTATITAVGNGWYRCTATGVRTTNTNNLVYVASANNTVSYTGDGTSGIFIWGAQLELGSTATDYTRNFGGLFPPRFDYDPVTLAPRGLLIEEQRTNLLTYSEQFDNAAWTKLNGTTVAANSTTAPDGASTADTLVEPTATNVFGVRQAVTLAAGAAAFSAYVKPNGRDWVQLIVAAGGSGSAFFNVATGVVGTTSGATATIASVGNGWFRCTIAFTATAGSNTLDVRLASADGVTSYAGNGTSGVFIWGAQLEAGAFATSYIPTGASQVTRTADTALIQAPNFAPWYNQSEGTFVAEWSPYAVTGSIVAQISAATNNDRFQILNDNANQIAVTTGGAGQGAIDAGTVNASAVNKLAYAYRTNDTAASLNNGAAVADNTVALPVVDRLCLGATVAPAAFLNGHIRSIRYYPVRLSNAQLQALTA